MPGSSLMKNVLGGGLGDGALSAAVSDRSCAGYVQVHRGDGKDPGRNLRCDPSEIANLVFDDADALFSERTEVSDSHDR